MPAGGKNKGMLKTDGWVDGKKRRKQVKGKDCVTAIEGKEEMGEGMRRPLKALVGPPLSSSKMIVWTSRVQTVYGLAPYILLRIQVYLMSDTWNSV